jgi:hypothetical protein
LSSRLLSLIGWFVFISIDKYFETHLSLSQNEANLLHFKYYREYGLAIEGLVRHHKVDALEYNTKVEYVVFQLISGCDMLT